MNRCLSLSDVRARCFAGMYGVAKRNTLCGAGTCDRRQHNTIDEGGWDACDTSAFFVSGRSAIGWRGDYAAWFYPEQNLIAAVRFCRYAPDEAPAEWLALELTSQVQNE